LGSKDLCPLSRFDPRVTVHPTSLYKEGLTLGFEERRREGRREEEEEALATSSTRELD
jgi:hypothetical protein